jgi:uncharacterized membrane protein
MFDLWRTETWHPLSVHFPIALLSVSTLTLLISFFIKKDNRRPWQNAASGLLFAGCLTAWIAIYTGNLADGVVARKICDPTVLKAHEIAAQTMTYLFTVAALLNVLLFFNFVKPALKTGVRWLIFLLMLAGTGYLVYAGHLGASLVYVQGAGVKDHNVDCSDY